MKVNKFIKSKIEKNYFFITGKINIDTKYFINQIEKGINNNNNQSFKTNLLCEMTDWKYFLNDIKFIKTILTFSDLIQEENLNEDKSWNLEDAWGFKQSFTNYTRIHDHHPCMISGAIMLNEHEQSLRFLNIDQELKSEPGNFALFSSFLKHGSKRNKSDKPRYGLSFNYGRED
jgi:hypothetical protein